MKMKNLSAVVTVFALSSCSAVAPRTTYSSYSELQHDKSIIRDVSSVIVAEGSGTQSILSCKSKRVEYIPIPPLPAGGFTEIKINDNGKATAILKSWPVTAEQTNKLLTNISTNITQSGVDYSGAFTLASASKSNKQYVIDFMKWRAEPLTEVGDKENLLGWVRVGAGLRLIVDITKNDGSATGSLFGLAIGVKSGKVAGSISTELIGMDSSDVTLAMPFTVDLSEGNIQKVVEALAIVKSKLYDPNTTLYPNLIAKIECAPVEVESSGEK